MTSLRLPAVEGSVLPVQPSSSAEEYVTWGQVSGLVRRRWPLLLVSLAACIGLALLYAAKTPKIYESSASILIDKDQYNLPEMVTHHATDESDLSTEIEVLRSARLSQAVVAQLGLKGSAGDVQKQLKVGRGDRNANVIWVRFRSRDSLLASAVPSALVDRYLADRTESAKGKVRNAITFLREQTDTLRKQLLVADQDLHDFRQKAGVVSLADEASTAVRATGDLRVNRSRLEAERSALQELVSQSDTSSATFRRLTAFPTLIGNPMVANLLRSVDELEGQRTEMLQRRTQKDPDVQALNRRITDADVQLRGITLTYLAGLGQQVHSLDKSLSSEAQIAAGLPGKNMQEDELTRKPKVLGDVYTLAETRLQEARIAESAASPGVSIIDRPSVPTAPVWPRTGLLVAVGCAIGLLAGIGLAWIRDGMDRSVHSRADVTRAVELPVLGMIPHIKSSSAWNSNTDAALISNVPMPGMRALPGVMTGSRNPSESELSAMGSVLEAYTWLETNLTFTERAGEPQTLVFTSAVAGEGKTVSAANMAIATARHGRRVLVIDGDLRRGRLHKAFGIPAGPGLSDVLLGTASMHDATKSVPVGGSVTVDVLTRGGQPSHPTALLKSAALGALIASSNLRYDLVILDSPPVNLVSDALLIGKLVDGVIVIARAGVTDATALSQAVKHLRDSNAPLLGVLLNDINLQRDSSYDESYRYLNQAGSYATAVES